MSLKIKNNATKDFQLLDLIIFYQNQPNINLTIDFQQTATIIPANTQSLTMGTITARFHNHSKVK